MLGLATATELRLAAYGVLLAAIGGWLVYERAHLIDEGEARIKTQDASARAAQKAQDDKTNAGVLDDLKSKLAALPAAEPPRVLRLCPAPRNVRTSPVTPGTQPPVAGSTGTGPSGMPSGDLGLDIGPQLQDSKRAAQVLAIYADETRDWAVRQSTPLPK